MAAHRNRIVSWIAAGAVAVIVAGFAAWWAFRSSAPEHRADAEDSKQVALGRVVYDRHCASCHGKDLEGQPEWRTRKPDGRLPAPPHDATGHTWHHADAQLFQITKSGLRPPLAPPNYQSDMPAFETTLTDDEIWASLAYIKSRWPPDIRERQRRNDAAYRGSGSSVFRKEDAPR